MPMAGGESHHPLSNCIQVSDTINYNQRGVAFAENANYWQSGQPEVSFNGDMPTGCTQIFSK